jgi:hypothetical protein
MTEMIPLAAQLGRFTHDTAITMAAVLVVLVAVAYWILKT